MATIPNSVNAVTVEFETTVVNSVEPDMLSGFEHCVKSDIATGYVLAKVFVKSVKDVTHDAASRHFQGLGKAVDISRINDKKMSEHYPSDAAVKAIVDAIQTTYETYSKRRENFGPFMKKKSGANHSVDGHGDHIHISVD